MLSRLPRHPQPQAGESLTSWLIRTAHANAERLSYVTVHLTGNANYWVTDPDRNLSPELVGRFQQATGTSRCRLEKLVLSQYSGQLFPALDRRGSNRWLLPLSKRGYRATRRGSLYCPLCLAEDATPYLRLSWRLSFLTACPQHGTLLLEACPACQHPFAPHLNDLGPGKNWYFEADLPFEWCPHCGEHLAAQPPQAPPQVLDLERRMLRALACDHMEWDGLGEVPVSEGFDVLHQLLYVLFQPTVRAALDFLPDAPMYPQQRNRSFEDFDLAGRQALMGRLAYLIHDWPHRFTDLMRQAGMTRRPLVCNMPTLPLWYDLVAEQFSQANGRRAYKQVPLLPWLTLAELAQRRDTAPTASERQRWDILWHYAQRPEKVPVARQLGVDWQLVHRTVTRYNETGPDALAAPTRGRPNRKKRLLTEAQEQELQAWLSVAERRSNEEMRDWFEARTGRRPDGTTLWIYRRGLGDHSRAGRKSS